MTSAGGDSNSRRSAGAAVGRLVDDVARAHEHVPAGVREYRGRRRRREAAARAFTPFSYQLGDRIPPRTAKWVRRWWRASSSSSRMHDLRTLLDLVVRRLGHEPVPSARAPLSSTVGSRCRGDRAGRGRRPPSSRKPSAHTTCRCSSRASTRRPTTCSSCGPCRLPREAVPPLDPGTGAPGGAHGLCGAGCRGLGSRHERNGSAGVTVTSPWSSTDTTWRPWPPGAPEPAQHRAHAGRRDDRLRDTIASRCDSPPRRCSSRNALSASRRRSSCAAFGLVSTCRAMSSSPSRLLTDSRADRATDPAASALQLLLSRCHRPPSILRPDPRRAGTWSEKVRDRASSHSVVRVLPPRSQTIVAKSPVGRGLREGHSRPVVPIRTDRAGTWTWTGSFQRLRSVSSSALPSVSTSPTGSGAPFARA